MPRTRRPVLSLPPGLSRQEVREIATGRLAHALEHIAEMDREYRSNRADWVSEVREMRAWLRHAKGGRR